MGPAFWSAAREGFPWDAKERMETLAIQIKKRNGVVVEFDAQKIRNAIFKANVAVAEEVQDQLEAEGYIPIPDEFREKLTTAISEIA